VIFLLVVILVLAIGASIGFINRVVANLLRREDGAQAVPFLVLAALLFAAYFTLR
jgi:hypothetical protein